MFFDFTIKDIIDILLFALLLYYLYKLMKDSGSLNIFAGIMIFLFVWVLVSKILGMRLLGSVFDTSTHTKRNIIIPTKIFREPESFISL